MKAALIATGNEIVSGQIVNTNASLLASLLSGEGVEVLYHLAVLDREEDLKESLDWLKQKGVEHVFTIGGLGPTRDDLTRKIIADYFGKGFDFRENLWTDLELLLKERSITPREGHKWQCYFPEGASVLMNTKGTAHGFKTNNENLSVWCVPGPPEELKSVYTNGIKPWLDENVNANMELYTWQCIGVPESELAHDIELALKGCTYELGFRASPPIVEVKLWVPKGHAQRDTWLQKVEKVVDKTLYSRNGQDYLKESLDYILKLKNEVSLVDQFSKGYIFSQILKSYGGALPQNMNMASGKFENISPGIGVKQDRDSLNILVQINERKFETSIELDVLKTSKSKRYRMLKLAESFKLIHGWLIEK